MQKTLVAAIATEFDRYASDHIDAHENALERIEALCREFMPSGSGFDAGTTFDFDKSNESKLVFMTRFHHMNADGYYDGWTEHLVTVRPAFSGIDIRVSGRDRNDIKDYIAETFDYALRQALNVSWDDTEKRIVYSRAD